MTGGRSARHAGDPIVSHALLLNGSEVAQARGIPVLANASRVSVNVETRRTVCNNFGFP